jgi:hypothetical protein
MIVDAKSAFNDAVKLEDGWGGWCDLEPLGESLRGLMVPTTQETIALNVSVVSIL